MPEGVYTARTPERGCHHRYSGGNRGTACTPPADDTDSQGGGDVPTVNSTRLRQESFWNTFFTGY